MEKYWESASDSPRFRELKSRKCTEDDFKVPEGSPRSSYGFFPPNPDIDTEILYSSIESLICLD